MDFNEAEFGKNRNNLVGFEDGNIPHGSGDSDVLNSNKLRLQHRLSVFEKHRNHVVQVLVEIVSRRSLGMRTGKTGNKANEQTGLRSSFDDR